MNNNCVNSGIPCYLSREVRKKLLSIMELAMSISPCNGNEIDDALPSVSVDFNAFSCAVTVYIYRNGRGDDPVVHYLFGLDDPSCIGLLEDVETELVNLFEDIQERDLM